MNDDAVRQTIIQGMLDSGVVEKQELNKLIHTHNKREYLVLVTIVDVTDWPKENDE